MSRPRILFVAGLTPIPAGGHGGQLTAATTLFESGLSRELELVPLSSTMVSVPPPPVPLRVSAAARRLGRFAAELPRVDGVLVFSSGAFALLEKGLMCMMARAAGRGVVVRLSAGELPGQVERHPTFERWLRLTLGSAHVICSQGPFWTSFFGKYPEASGKIVEMRNGIELPPPRPERSGRGDRIVFVGATARTKGVFELLDAFRAARVSHPEATLTYAGGGGDLEALRAAVGEAGLGDSVSIRGWVPKEQIAALLSEHDVFALPSHWEGLPNALLEAMAAGLPVIATRVGSIPDAVTDGESGLLVEPGDTAGVTRALAALLGDPDRARAMGRAARRAVEERYGIEQVWPRYAEALRRALREAGRAT